MGIFGGPSKQQIQQVREKIRQEQAQKQESLQSMAQQIISLYEGMQTDSKCQALMNEIETVMEANKDSLLSISCNPEPIKVANMAIFLHIDDPNVQPWELARKKTIKISYIAYGLSLSGPTEAAFMYWLLQRNPFLTYKDYRGPSRNMEDVLAHCLNIYTTKSLATLYNAKRL